MISALADRLAACLPQEVAELCEVLQRGGFEAVVVGGAVRDAVMGRQVSDWDVATDAAPAQVQRLFRKTLATGIAHGTVTVLCGRHNRAVEVTTFRGEGVYLDGRRPSEVTFGVPLAQDLARRDITINALAYDPSRRRLEDPFGGLADIEQRLIRAVGDPAARLAEDGLRVMRVVRFAATLGFAIDPDTEAALAAAVPSLGKVAGERIKAELWKLMMAPRVAPILGLMRARGITACIAPEWADVDIGAWASALDGAASDGLGAIERLGLLLAAAPLPELQRAPAPRAAHEAALAMAARWRCSSDERQALAAVAQGLRQCEAVTDLASAAACLAGVTRAHVPALRRAVGAMASCDRFARRALPWFDAALTAQVALATKELPIDGAALMRLAQRPPGVWVGQTLATLLRWTWEAPAERTHAEALAREARRLLVIEA